MIDRQIDSLERGSDNLVRPMHAHICERMYVICQLKTSNDFGSVPWNQLNINKIKILYDFIDLISRNRSRQLALGSES
jgi:hypothetical protein